MQYCALFKEFSAYRRVSQVINVLKMMIRDQLQGMCGISSFARNLHGSAAFSG